MRLILLALFILLAAGCSTPSSDPAQVTNRTQATLAESYAYFGSNEKELELFIEQADPSLADRILANSMQSNADSDHILVRRTQIIVARMEQLKAPPERFAQLCERLRFVVIRSSEQAYPWARVHENLCLRGMQNETVLSPADSSSGTTPIGTF